MSGKTKPNQPDSELIAERDRRISDMRPIAKPATAVGSAGERLSLNDPHAQLKMFEAIALGLAHEFNNAVAPLAFIEASCPDPEVQLTACVVLDRVKELAAEITYLARKPKNDFCHWYDASEVIRQAVITCLKHHDIEAHLAIMPSVMIAIEQAQLVRIIQNIVRNALQAMDYSGRLNVTALTIRPNDAPAFVRISIIDSGCGIPPENLNRIFDLHFTTKSNGTGIGLAYVKYLVECYGGSISATSTLGTGSIFRLIFPTVQPPKDETA